MKVLILVLALTLPAYAQSPNAPSAQHAAEVVAHLHDGMLDPASFVLDSVYVTKANKRGHVSVCYAFRSHNAMGGYAEARAVEDGDFHNELSVIKPSADGAFMGYDTGWIRPCSAKNIDREITADVAALATSLYKKTR